MLTNNSSDVAQKKAMETDALLGHVGCKSSPV